MTSILIPLALAGTGLFLNNAIGGKEERSSADPPPNNGEDAHHPNDLDAVFEEVADSAIPTREQFVHGGHVNLVPQYRSDATRNDLGTYSGRRLGTFTGTDQDAYRRKKEVENIFTPEPQIKVDEAFLKARERYDAIPNQKIVLNNMRPFEQQKVGPGLNLGYDQEARTTGFQELTRIMPRNVNEYRLHQHEARVITGGDLSRGTARVELNDENLKDLTDQAANRIPFGGVNPHKAPMEHPEIYDKPQFREHREYFGGGATTSFPSRSEASTNLRPDDHQTSYAGLFHGVGQQRGGYSLGNVQVPLTDRGGDTFTPLHGSSESKQTLVHGTNDRMGTMRETENLWAGIAKDPHGLPHPKTGFTDRDLVPTHRESSNAARAGGFRDPYGRAATERNFDLSGNIRSATLYEHTPGPMRTNTLADPRERSGTITAKARDNIHDTYASSQNRVHGHGQMGDIGSSRGGQKIASENPWMSQMSLTKELLADNPYHATRLSDAGDKKRVANIAALAS
jgi:hypothetical protein